MDDIDKAFDKVCHALIFKIWTIIFFIFLLINEYYLAMASSLNSLVSLFSSGMK